MVAELQNYVLSVLHGHFDQKLLVQVSLDFIELLRVVSFRGILGGQKTVDYWHFGLKECGESIEESFEEVGPGHPFGALLLLCKLIFGLVDQDIEFVGKCRLNKPVNEVHLLSQVGVDEQDCDDFVHFQLAQRHLLILCSRRGGGS